MNNFNYIIDLEAAITTLYEKKRIWILATSCILALAVVWVIDIPEEYTASLTLAPTKSEKDSSLYSQTNSSGLEVGSIGSSLGLSGNGASTETNIALVTLESWSFVDQFIRKYNFEDEILGIERWNKSNDEIIYFSNYDPISEEWSDSQLIESAWFRWELYKEFIDELEVVYKKNGLAEIYFTHYSPKLAAKILTTYVDELNEYLQIRKLTTLDKNIRNLELRLSSGLNNADLNQKLNSILAQQIRLRVLAEAADEFAFVKVNQVMIPYFRSAPKRAVLMIGIAVISTLLSMLITLLIFGQGILSKNEPAS